MEAAVERAFREERGGPGHADPPRRRLPARRGCRSGCLRGRGRDVAQGRGSLQPRRLDHRDRAPQGDRPTAPRACSRRPHGARWPSSRGLDAQEHRPEAEESAVADDRLRLIFTCCHPALALQARVALTLQYARRAQHRRDRAGVPRQPRRRWRSGSCAPSARSRDAGIPYRVPPRRRAARAPRRRAGGRLPDLQRGLRGHRGRALLRGELCSEAIRLGAAAVHADARRGRGARPAGADAAARRPARRAARRATARYVLLERAGPRAVGSGPDPRGPARARGGARAASRPGPYQLQAAIAALHAEAPSRARHRLAADRRALRRAGRLAPSPVVEAQPGGGRGDGARAGRPASSCSRPLLDDPAAGALPAALRRPGGAAAARRRARGSRAAPTSAPSS